MHMHVHLVQVGAPDEGLPANMRVCAHGGRWTTPSNLGKMLTLRSATWAWVSWVAMTSEHPLF